jgi:O-antigen ligase
MLAFYGTASLFDLRKPWRWLIFVVAIAASLYGGFRSAIPFYLLALAVLFYVEGPARSRLLPALILAGILGAAIALPFATKLPLSVQRSISFLPFVEVEPIAAQDAEFSTQWRWDMWREVWPEVPQHLLLGKGYSLNGQQMEMLLSGMTRGLNPAAGAILAGDYHSGPLSVVIPLGIFGVVGVLWFFWAAIKVLYQNYKFSDTENQRINRFLFAYFIVKVIFFFAVFGAFYSDIALFAGLAGLSVAINGGVRKPVAASAEAPVFTPFKLAGAVR